MTLDEGRDDDLDKLNVTVNYIAHSGFTVETENRVLIFDYFNGQVDIEDRDKDYMSSTTMALGTILTPSS